MAAKKHTQPSATRGLAESPVYLSVVKKTCK